MNVTLLIARWIAPFAVGLCLTAIAALIGAFPFVVVALGSVLKDGPSSANIDLLEASLGFGAMLAAPGTLVLGPVFYLAGGSRLSVGVFGLICGALGFALVEALIVAVVVIDQHNYPMDYIRLPLLGAFIGLVTGLIFRVVMKYIEVRLTPAKATSDRSTMPAQARLPGKPRNESEEY